MTKTSETEISSTTFDILERLANDLPPIKGGFARGTGGVDVDNVVPALATEIGRLRGALNVAVSRGCDHCADTIRQARSYATPAPEPQPKVAAEPVAWASCPGCNGTGDQGGNPSYGACDDCGGSGKIGTITTPPVVEEAVKAEAWQEQVNEIISELGDVCEGDTIDIDLATAILRAKEFLRVAAPPALSSGDAS